MQDLYLKHNKFHYYLFVNTYFYVGDPECKGVSEILSAGDPKVLIKPIRNILRMEERREEVEQRETNTSKGQALSLQWLGPHHSDLSPQGLAVLMHHRS